MFGMHVRAPAHKKRLSGTAKTFIDTSGNEYQHLDFPSVVCCMHACSLVFLLGDHALLDWLLCS